MGIADYGTNGDCAAGTGSFMDQQANRLLYDIEDVGDIVQGAGKAASIAGRCSVFAKSDMIHAQQKGYQPPEVLKGLCNAVVRNYRGTITKGKEIGEQVAFIGGVAANTGAVAALREAFEHRRRPPGRPRLLRLDGRHRQRPARPPTRRAGRGDGRQSTPGPAWLRGRLPISRPATRSRWTGSSCCATG